MLYGTRLFCLLPLVSVIAWEEQLVDYQPFTEDAGHNLTQSPELLDIAVPPFSKVRIPLNLSSQIAVVQEGVAAYIDCQPWSSMFEGGEVSWLRGPPDGGGNAITLKFFSFNQLFLLTVDYDDVGFTPEEYIGLVRETVDERWFNITYTLIVQGAEDPSDGFYICRVCTDKGTLDEVCHDAKLRLFLLGNGPSLEKATDNREPKVTALPLTQ